MKIKNNSSFSIFIFLHFFKSFRYCLGVLPRILNRGIIPRFARATVNNTSDRTHSIIYRMIAFIRSINPGAVSGSNADYFRAA